MTKFSLGKPPYKKPLLACKSVIRSSGPGVGGGALKEVWVELSRRGLQIAHFATTPLFDPYLPCFAQRIKYIFTLKSWTSILKGKKILVLQI